MHGMQEVGRSIPPSSTIDRSASMLGERLHGMQEVGGSIPPSSTIDRSASMVVAYSKALKISPGPHRLEA
ncbi:MAG: hypothetical protein NTW94_03950 [Legionellales bacterium]|nr:hypothetical protein [Legionellales bacterium]